MRRFNRHAPGRVRLPKEETQASSSSSSQVQREHDGGVFVNTTGMPVGEVEEGRRGFLGFGPRAGRAMPLNPLTALRSQSEHHTEDRTTARFLQAVQQLHGKHRRRNESLTLQLTTEQQHDIVNRYAQTRWYGFLWHPFRNVTERQFKWWRRAAHFALFVVTLAGLIVALVLYYREVQTVLLLDPEDRRDYQHIVSGMRFSEVYHLAMEVLQKEDPLEALPGPARYHLVLEAAREKGWHKLDWDLEARTRYTRTPLQDMDFIHAVYWGVMYIGSAVTGGGELFSDRFGNLMEARGAQRRREMEASFVEQGPEAPPSDGVDVKR